MQSKARSCSFSSGCVKKIFSPQMIGVELARLAPPYTVDNFEGLAVFPDKRGGTIIYILSDDNFNPLQRTLLLQFRLPG